MLNPFVKKPISNFGVSLVGLAPKYEANWQLIANLSYPLGNIVHGFCYHESCQLKYSTLENGITMISSLDLKVCVGKNWCLKLAFRLLNGLLSHADFNLFRIQVDVKNHKYCLFYETKSSDMIAHLCKNMAWYYCLFCICQTRTLSQISSFKIRILKEFFPIAIFKHLVYVY